VRTHEHDGVHIVEITGEIDLSNVAGVRVAALGVPNDALGLVLDLTATTFIDSSTLGLIFELQRDFERRCQAFRVVSPSGSNPRRVLELAALDRQTPCHEDRESAVADVLAQTGAPPRAQPAGR
jgi:anti-sigma B factor antagonist